VHPYLLMAPLNRFSERVQLCADRLTESGVAALGGLYDLTSVRLVRFAATITRNGHDAEDAVAAALVRVATCPYRLTQAQRPWPYLLRMVRNESLQIVRRKQRCQTAGSLSDLRTRRLVDQAEQEETHRAVWAALRRIPTAQAEVVVLKIWEEMTFAQIAEVLDLSPDTVASRYRYAMEKLFRSLKSHEKEACHE
jgi:RNA polymerase sigma-70 factor (ECF subfamily)